MALRFLTFVLFCFNYFGSTVKESLDERSSTIRFELENFHRLKEESLEELLSLHKRIEEMHVKDVPSIGKFTEDQLSYTSAEGCQRIELHNRFCEQVEQKLTNFQSSKALLQQGLQKSIAVTIRPLVLAKIKQERTSKNAKSASAVLSSQVKQSLKALNK